MKQTSKEQMWYDEAKTAIPYNRTTKLERLKETKSALILKDAKAVNERLIALKETFKSICVEVFEQAALENDIKTDTKGNYTWYNFDRSIKIEVSINERIDFDDLTITAAKEKLEEFLNLNIDTKIDFAKELVVDAFSTSRGKLDSKKVLSLLKYRERIKHPLFQESLSLIEKSIRRPDSKTYYRVSVRDDDGKYNAIELNFSNI